MCLNFHLCKIMFLICHTLTFAHQEEGDPGAISMKRPSHDFPSCRDSFDIQKDKIIRTQDSKAMGARYLNERDVVSREECMQLCCSSDNCDVFVYEEMKVPGGCYLFECGPPEDFKCKFTRYKNYTSGFLNVNQQLHELESQIKYSQHERELAKLREPSVPTEPPYAHRTTISTKSKEVPEQYAQEPAPNHQGSNKRGCKRNQFECHSSGECIAIYNACDGIPQCADGSDESPELGCPALETTVPAPVKNVHVTSAPVLRHQQQEYIPESDLNGGPVNLNRELSAVPVRKQWPSSEDYGVKNQQILSGGYQSKIPSMGVGQMSSLNMQDVSRSGYGREGEELMNYHGPDPSTALAANQYRHNPGSQIFTHKGEGLLPQNSRFQQQPHSYIPPESSIRTGLQYNEPGQMDYAKYYVENPQYNRLYSGQSSNPNNWQSPPKPHNMNIPEQSVPQGLDELAGSRSEIPQSGPYPDYYYEEMYKNKMQQQQPPFQAPAQTVYQPSNEMVIPPKPIQPKLPQVVPETKESSKTETHPEHKELPTAQTTSTVTASTKEAETKHKEEDESTNHNHGKSSHRKLDQLHADVRLKESILNLEEEIQSTTPRGAVLSLTMGLCITGIMLILVGCRMRMVSKRMRRGGKGYAHDADFLVNGMYL